jgi:hypothetical protein
VERDNVQQLQALLHLATQISQHQPALAAAAIALISDIVLLPEASGDTLDASDRAGRASVKDATGLDIRGNCIEALLVWRARCFYVACMLNTGCTAVCIVLALRSSIVGDAAQRSSYH